VGEVLTEVRAGEAFCKSDKLPGHTTSRSGLFTRVGNRGERWRVRTVAPPQEIHILEARSWAGSWV
jgi:hypothetical protein